MFYESEEVEGNGSLILINLDNVAYIEDAPNQHCIVYFNSVWPDESTNTRVELYGDEYGKLVKFFKRKNMLLEAKERKVK
jgi:hypothetical protein